jgi:hypothetical protein
VVPSAGAALSLSDDVLKQLEEKGSGKPERKNLHNL